MRFSLLISFMLVCLSVSNAQYMVYGTITDEEGEPYPGIKVEIDETDHQTTTDEDGFYMFEDVEPADYAVIVHHPYGEVYRALYVYEEDQEFNIKIRRRIEFDEVIVKNTRITGEEPFNKEDISSEYIDKNNSAKDVPYIFRKLRSTVVNSDAGNGVGYTGIRIRGLDPGHVNVSINGIPLNDAESQLVFWVDLPDILSSTESIQLQRGLGSSSFGSGNFGASVNLNTNKTHIEPYITARTGYGSFNTYRGSIALGTGLMNGRFSLDGRASFTHSDGYIDRARSDLRSFYLSGAFIGLNSSLRLNVINGHEITYQAWNGVPYSYADDEDLRTFNSAGMEKVKEAGDTPYDDEVDNYNQTHYQLFYNKMYSNGDFTLTGFYTRGRGFFENYRADQELSDFNFFPIDSISGDTIRTDDLVRRKWLDNHFYGINLARNFEFENTIIKSGLHGSRYQGEHYGTVIFTEELGSFRFPFEYYRNDAVKHEASAFVKIQQGIGNRFFLFGDLQYRFVDYQYGGGTDDNGRLQKGDVQYNFFNPKAGVSYRITEELRAFGSVARGNREPNRDDFIEAGPRSEPRHEELTDYEVGMEYQDNRARLGLYGYYMDYKNQLVLTGRINDVGEYARVNVPNSYRMGIELDAQFEVFDGLTTSFNATFSENKIESFTEYVDDWDTGEQFTREFKDTDISFSPGVIGFVGLNYTWDDINLLALTDQLSFSLDHKYVGEQYLDNTMTEEAKLDAFSYGEFEVAYSTSYEWIKDLRLSFRIINIWDELYESNGWIYRFRTSEPSNVDGDPYARREMGNLYNLTGLYPQAGRHFMTSLTVKF